MLFLDRSREVLLLFLVKDVAPCSMPEARDVVVVGPDVGFYHFFPGGGDGVRFIAIPCTIRVVLVFRREG